MVAADLADAAARGPSGPVPDAAPIVLIERQDGIAQFLPSGPDQTEDTVHALLIDGCFHAQERIVAVTPYFVPDASPRRPCGWRHAAASGSICACPPSRIIGWRISLAAVRCAHWRRRASTFIYCRR